MRGKGHKMAVSKQSLENKRFMIIWELEMWN